MTGEIARAITLVTYGTAFLKDGYDITSLTLSHPSFTFENKVAFYVFKEPWFGKGKWVEFAADPISWLGKLKKDGCRELRFVFEPDNTTMLNDAVVPDYKLAGFVGGGGRRLLEAVYEGYVDYWTAKEEVTAPEAPDHRIWTITYGRVATRQVKTESRPADITDISVRLATMLGEIRDFARKEEMDPWGDYFDQALQVLNGVDPFAAMLDRQIMPLENKDPALIRLLAASGKAWCFGGMGSWNDFSFEEGEKKERYESLSAGLYSLLMESCVAVANYRD
jgi:hypothetical protein